MHKDRNSNIELLRLLLMVGILVYHLIIHGIGLKYLGTSNYSADANTLPLLIASGLLAPATYCFVFITGYYGLNMTFKKVLYLVFTCFTISIATTAMNSILWHTPMKIDQTVLLPLATGKWWFMTNYLELMLLSPFINKGIAELDRRKYKLLLLVLFSYNALTLAKALPNLGSNLLGLINVYLLASYMKKYEKNLSWIKSLCLLFVLVIALASILTLVYLLVPSHHNWTLVLLSYNNPLIVGMAVAVFFMAKGLKPLHSKLINRCCQPALFIYLISEGLRPNIYKHLVLPPPEDIDIQHTADCSFACYRICPQYLF